MIVDVLSVGAWTAFDRVVQLDAELTDGATVRIIPVDEANRVFYGDCSINVAAIASALGAKAGLVSVVGDDFGPSGYRDHLERLGVDLSGVVEHPGSTSGNSLNISTPGGASYCISQLDAALHQSEYEPPAEIIAGARWVVINESFEEYTLEAARIAHEHRIPVVLNGMVATAGLLAAEFLRLAELMIINRAEAAALAEHVPVTSHPSRRIVTMGAAGAEVMDDSSVCRVAPIGSRAVVDTTGAGDAFVAGVVAGLLRGLSLQEAARIGSSTASFVIEAFGCQTNLPSWGDVQERLVEDR